MSRLARRAHIRIVGLAVLALAAAACSSGGGPKGATVSPSPSAAPASAAPRAAGGPNAVTIYLVAFNPPVLDIARGTTVTWTQTDQGAVHTVTSGTVDTDPTGATTTHPDGRFDSGQLAEGRQFAFTFSQPGTYPYFCVIHQATMRGEVRVR
jgi:plastocyanin